MDSPFAELHQHLTGLAPVDAVHRLDRFLAGQEKSFEPRPFYYAFSGASRRFPKVPVPDESLRIPSAPDFAPRGWTLDQLARTVLLLSLQETHPDVFLPTFRALLDTADMRESVALFAALPLLKEPFAESLVPAAREGLRSNIVDVFDAIALHNPFPAARFDEEGWNQMILKAIFIRRPIHRIQGLERRANPTLAQSLTDLAHERWAANRPVPPELWRSCQGQSTPSLASDVSRVLSTAEPGQREAAALLIAAAPEGVLAPLRPAVADLLTRIASGDLTWDSLGQALESGTA
ncbi:MAG: hypothetical protein DVB23_002764 [Verrucomicrobia bacterium]|jgi:hypothetical protein|nr:MAG: hypothetical protein DVB23_002764 [Verrucomicrobiota bacterium]